jgi:hypothetical protein
MATPITITIPHKLGRAEARLRVDAGVDHFKTQIGAAGGPGRISHLWDGDRLTFHAQGLGQSMTGRIDVHDNDIRIELDLPAFLGAFADKIGGLLKKQGTLLLENKKK